MKIHCLAKPAEFGELKLGACFAFSENGRLLIAVKFGSASSDDQSLSEGVVIWPGHPALGNGLPGIYRAQVFSGPLIHFVDAELVPSFRLPEIRLTRGFDAGASFLNVQGHIVVVARGEGNAKVPIDLGSGKLTRIPSDPVIAITKWKIVQPAPNGVDRDVICEYPELI